MLRDPAVYRDKLATEPLDPLAETFELRPYQVRAIRVVEAAIGAGRRHLLVAMATGTGKTRTAVGLVHRMLKTRVFRRVLFLVDRSVLGAQAQEVFTELRLENLQTFAQNYDVMGIERIVPAAETQVHVATVQCMVDRILCASPDQPSVPIDRYDCVIADEGYRAYNLDGETTRAEMEPRGFDEYVSAYRRMLDHVSNIVLLRRVRSRTLYEQMLGRATRLCAEIGKKVFRIYDAIGLYEVLSSVSDMKPLVKDSNRATGGLSTARLDPHVTVELGKDRVPWHADPSISVDKSNANSTIDLGRNKTVVTAISKISDRPVAKEAYMVVIHGLELGKKFNLNRPQTVIGRSSKADIQIDQEAVSRNHCEIMNTGKAIMLRDMGSVNGTYVNDEMIDEYVLRDGDFIKVGRCIFKFLSGNNIENAYHEEIYRLATVDGLTQVFNRRYFVEALEREIVRALRYRRDLSLIMFDIDRFKGINDRFGHLAGDHVLKHLASVIKTRIQREATFARYGGEEFAIVLPEIDSYNAMQFAEKIRKLVEVAEFKFEDAIIPVTVSIGVASLCSEIEDALEFIKQADTNLFAAKEGGRNRVVG